MFETLFADCLNPDHELIRAAQLIDWDSLHETLSHYYSKVGRAGLPNYTGIEKNIETGGSKSWQHRQG